MSGFDIKLVAENGMCSYGVGNVGTYNSTFTKRNVIDQAYDNPAGYYNYTELISQAKGQTYVLTRLLGNTDISESVFLVFLPNETLPTTDFLSAPPPADPNPPTIVTDPNSNRTDSPSGTDGLADSGVSLLSYSLVVVWGFAIAGLLF